MEWKSSRTSRHNNFSAAVGDAGVEYSLTHFSWRRKRRSRCLWCLRWLPWGIQVLLFLFSLSPVSIWCWQQSLRSMRSVLRLCSCCPRRHGAFVRKAAWTSHQSTRVFCLPWTRDVMFPSVASKLRQIYGRAAAGTLRPYITARGAAVYSECT